MHDRVYRGTSLPAAVNEEFATGEVHGSVFTNYSGWMNPDDADDDHSGEYLEDLPWETGPPGAEQQPVTGGITDRLGAAQSFAAGAIPLVFHLDRNSIPNLTDVPYRYGMLDRMEGVAAWVDGSSTGELRVNGSLEGLLVENDDRVSTKYYGQGLRDRARQYNDELEKVVTGTDRVDIENATDAVVSYVRRPKANLAALDDYARVETRLSEERGQTVIGEWDEERVLHTLYDEIRERAPAGFDVYVAHVDTMLVTESWGYRDDDVLGVYEMSGRVDPERVPEFVLGD